MKPAIETNFPSTCDRLRQWGKWAKDGNGFGLGFKSMSAEQQAINGGYSSEQAGYTPKSIQQVEEIMKVLKREKADEFILIDYYFVKGYGNVRSIANKLKRNRNATATNLYNTVCWVDGWLFGRNHQ